MTQENENLIARIFERRRRRNAFFALLYALIVLPLALIGFLSYRDQSASLTSAALSRRGSIAYLAAAVLTEKLGRLTDLGVSFATRVRFSQLVAEGKWDDAIAILGTVSRDFPSIERVFIASKDGTLMVDAPALPGVRGQNFSQRDWYAGVSREWKPYVSQVYKRAAEPRYNVVAVATPIKDGAQEVVGILVMQVRLDQFFDWSSRIDAGPASYAYFVDPSGNVAGHPRYSPQGELVNFGEDPAVRDVLRGGARVETVFDSRDGQAELVAYAPAQPYGWGAVVVQPTSAAFAPRDAALRFFAFVYGFIGILGLLFAYVVLRVLGELDAYRQKERIVLDSIGDGLVAIDRAWTVTLWNDAAERISGYSRADALGKPLRSVLKFIREHDRTENITFIEHAMVAGEAATLENNTLLVRKDGAEIHVGDSASPIRGTDGSIVGAIVIFRDVTAERDARSTKSDFAYATHQLRTPVTKAAWAVEAAAEEPDPAKMRAALKDAGSALHSLVQAVNELATVSEIDQEMAVPHLEDVAVAAIVDGAIAAAKEKAGKAGALVGVEHEGGAEILRTDRKMLTRALAEIIENAIVYGPEGAAVRVKTRVRGGDAVFEVRDSGMGIPESERPLVFHKFFRASNVDTTRSVGAGLGLYICERYVKMLGGKVWFRGRDEGGTTFFASVPLRRG